MGAEADDPVKALKALAGWAERHEHRGLARLTNIVINFNPDFLEAVGQSREDVLAHWIDPILDNCISITKLLRHSKPPEEAAITRQNIECIFGWVSEFWNTKHPRGSPLSEVEQGVADRLQNLDRVLHPNQQLPFRFDTSGKRGLSG